MNKQDNIFFSYINYLFYFLQLAYCAIHTESYDCLIYPTVIVCNIIYLE